MKIYVDDDEKWVFNLYGAHYVWERAGTDLRDFTGRKSGECSAEVRALIDTILDNPSAYMSGVGYLNLRATVARLLDLFFLLRERPDGIVRTES